MGKRGLSPFVRPGISFNPEPTATAFLLRPIAVAVGSGLNEPKADRP
jgi:hypothetical protein